MGRMLLHRGGVEGGKRDKQVRISHFRSYLRPLEIKAHLHSQNRSSSVRARNKSSYLYF
jgi:hypothetical protein